MRSRNVTEAEKAISNTYFFVCGSARVCVSVRVGIGERMRGCA
jgi:hypothetical protein